MIFKFGQASIKSFRTVVALLTKSTSYPWVFIVFIKSFWATYSVAIVNSFAVNASIPACEMPSFANILVILN